MVNLISTPIHLLLLVFLPGMGLAQSGKPCSFTRLKGEQLMETYWQYQSTIHLASGVEVHKGTEGFSSFLHFRYDSTFSAFTNGQHSDGKWSYNGGELLMPYRDEIRFCADNPSADILLLKFTQKENKQDYVYRFRQVTASQAPFKRPWYELPTILVEPKGKAANKKEEAIPWWAFWRKWTKPKEPPPPPPIPITIEVSGGGYYGGLNPVSRQYVRINSEGRVIREVQTQREGLMVTKTNITRHELEDFAEWIQSQGYFELKREYDCVDMACRIRKGEKPRPMPLQIMVLYGQKRHVLTVQVFGLDHHHVQYIPYPQIIDRLVESVYRMADRPPS